MHLGKLTEHRSVKGQAQTQKRSRRKNYERTEFSGYFADLQLLRQVLKVKAGLRLHHKDHFVCIFQSG